MSFNFCVPAGLFEHGNDLFGLPGLTVINIFGDHAAPITLSLCITGLWLFVCAAVTICPAYFGCVLRLGCGGSNEVKSRSSLRQAVFFYQFITATFFFALGTQLNKMVVLMAAVHNWCEWIILGNVYIGLLNSFGILGGGARGILRWNIIFTVWILVVMLGIIAIPDTLQAFAFEEVFGLWPDYQLFFISIVCTFKFNSAQQAPGVFWKFAVAATFHLAQILLLLAAGMGLISMWPTGQVFIVITAFFNYWFYSVFALALDDWLEKQQNEEKDAEKQNEEKDAEKQYPAPSSRLVPSVPSSVISVSTCKMSCLMLVCLVLSSVSVLSPPLIFGDCVIPVVESGAYLEFTRIELNPNVEPELVQDQMVQTMLSAQQYPGNLMSKVFVSEDSFMLLEKWNETSGKAYHQAHKNRFGNTTGFSISSSEWHQLDAEEHSPLFQIPSSHDVNTSALYCASQTHSGFTHLQIKSKYIDAVKNKMANMVKVSRAEDGNNFYIAMAHATDDEQFLVVEQWRDHEALDRHMHTGNVLRLLGFSKTMTKDEGLDIQGGFRELVPC